MIQVFKPYITEEDIEAVSAVLRSGWIGLGPKSKELEEKFAAYVGTKRAVGLNSATAALHLAVRILKEEGAQGEVLVPTMTFASTAMAPIYEGLPVKFVDIREGDLNIDFDDAEKKVSKKSRIIIPVHYGGNPVDMKRLKEFAEGHDLRVIEDAAHAAGSFYKGKHLGSFGDLGTFSFHAVKNIATGDAGMIVTDNEKWAGKAERLRWVGISKSTFERSESKGYDWYYEIGELGYKYHINDIMAAMALVQLKRLEETNARRREIAAVYREELASLDWLSCLETDPDTKSAQHNFVVKVQGEREKFRAHLKKNGIQTGVHYMPAHLHPYFKKLGNADCPQAEKVWPHIVTLPLYPELSDGEVGTVVGAIRSYRP